MKKKITVFIADDHTLFRKAMVNLIQTFNRVSVVKDAENGKELLTLMKYESPDVALIDLQMPVLDGTDTCEQILAKYATTKVIVLTMHDSEKYILHMIEMGVHGFLLKNSEPDELERAIYAVYDNDFYHSDLIASVLRKSVREKTASNRPDFSKAVLSDREKEVLIMICREFTIREIADRLSISENTVRNHRVSIMEKTEARNTVGLVKFAFETGLIK
ncbi:MAG TPA: response regulator transcription factor [Cyclobacteriaceae bacterium]|nr:response regulator transcription factor [Cyclobacteriaceae bacterium]